MVAAEVQEPLAQRIGPYEVLLDIGSGGMGTISLARATGDGLGVDGFARLVALKRPLGALASDPEVMQRFLDEARLLAQIHHANVVGIHQIGSDADGQFLVLDYIEGGTLDELLTRTILHRKKLPPPVVLRILGDVLAGLHAVHEAADVDGRPLQMLHRDVSAQNVLVGKDGVSRIADFGIAKAIISSTVTDKAYLQGRIPYMAPEYLRREDVDRRLDVYAAGVTMWTALAGRMPWGDAGEAQMVKHIVLDGVPPLSTAGVTIAPAIEEIVARACVRDPAVRYASAREMLTAVEDLGRRTGWIASHAEVAAIVEELLGMEIRARRAAIARRLSVEGRAAPKSGARAVEGSAEAGGPTERPSFPRSDVTPSFTSSARSLPTPPAGLDSIPTPERRSRVAWVTIAVLVAVLAALVWKWGPPATSLAGSAGDVAPGTEPRRSGAAASTGAGVEAPATSGEQPLSPPRTPASSTDSPSSSARVAEPAGPGGVRNPPSAPSGTGALGAPSASNGTGALGAKSASPRTSSSPAAATAPAPVPTAISTSNPYR